MSDQEDNLRVLTEHVRDLGKKQNAAGGRVLTAGQAVPEGLGQRLWTSHGVISASMNMAVSTAETSRKTATTNQYKMSTDLRDRLNSAADNYHNADWRAGRDIGSCGL